MMLYLRMQRNSDLYEKTLITVLIAVVVAIALFYAYLAITR